MTRRITPDADPRNADWPKREDDGTMPEHEHLEKSRGHLEYYELENNMGTVEFFVRNDEVFRAPVKAPVMPDGYRCGRWQTSLSKWPDYRTTVYGDWPTV